MPDTRQWCFGPFCLDPATGSLWRDTVLLPLPPKPCAVLAFLVAHAGQVVAKETLLAAVWPDTAVTEGVLKTCLAQIRQVLGETARTPQYIATLPRRGYRFVAPVVVSTAAGPAGAAELPGQPPILPPHPEAAVLSAAERRHLTVLFCDVVGSTALAGRLDPEAYHAVLRTYHQTCAEVVQRFDGYVAQYLGDGVLAYFGYPVAHDDDALRAVRAGLALLQALAALDPHPALPPGEPLAVRLGVHTGLVVVDDVGEGPRAAPLALGDTLNIAARLQHVAAPNMLVISAATHQLVAGYVRCKALGAHRLPGLTQPLDVYHVLGTSGVQSRLAVAALHGLTPLVGRVQDVALLLDRWTYVTEGRGQVVLLSGEAGIGKSRLAQGLIAHVADTGHVWLEGQGSPYYQQTAFYPLIEPLERAVLHFDREEPPPQKLHKLEACIRQYGLPLAEVVPLLAALLSLPLSATYAPLSMPPEQQKQRTLQALLTLLLGMAAQQPLLLVLEDLHWVDPSTLEWLSLLVDQGPTTCILTLCTCRPDFRPPWTGRAHLTQVTVARLPQAQTATLTQQVAHGKALPPEVVAQIVTKTDGVPLFVEELTKMVLESDLLRQREEHYELTGPLPPLAIPATLHDSLMARLDRLGVVKSLAQLGATLGREFPYALLRAVAPWEEEALHQGLHQLVATEFLYQRGVPPQATYVFKHALIQDAAYQSLLKSTRQQVHQRIAEVLEAQFPATAATQPELVAQHYTAAGLPEQAIPYWQRAGQRASERSANLEAISHFTTGLELLTALPETPARTQHALTLHLALGAALQMAKGLAAPEVEQAYTQARALCHQVGETPELAPVLLGLWRFYLARPQLHTARELGDTLLRLAQRAHDPTLAVVAHYTLGATCFYLGALPVARQHLEEALARSTPAQRQTPAFRIGQDPEVACRIHAARTLWVLGYPAQARARLHEALALAHELAHPFSLAWARCWAAWVYQFYRDVLTVHAHAEAAVAFSTAQGFPLWAAWGRSLRGWALALQGQGEAGMTQLREGIAALRATGSAQHVPYFSALLADVSIHLGHPEDGLQPLAEAHTLVEQHDERYWEAEVCRLRGVVLLRQSMLQQVEAEAWLQGALEVARRQEAKALELRAAMSLSRLWQQQGKRTEAYELLALVYNWFTEGFDTVDLQEAHALLDELGT